MLATVDGIVILVSATQTENADWGISVIPAPIVTLDRADILAKEFIPILVTVSGRVRPVMLLLLMKAFSAMAMEVVPFGGPRMTTFPDADVTPVMVATVPLIEYVRPGVSPF
jgi:hypothetical protein